MEISVRTIKGTLILGELLVAPSAVWAAEPSPRAALRRQVEARIARVEERLDSAQPASQPTEHEVAIVRGRLELARTLLSRNNDRAARIMVDNAETILDRAVTTGEER